MATRRDKPKVVVIAGPNGAGKSTAAPRILQDVERVEHFVNADTIARGLSAFEPERVAIEAGRVMLRRLDELAQAGESFAFETTLASQGFAKRLLALRAAGYESSLHFLSLPNPTIAVRRVRRRVAAGGHAVPDGVVRRRFRAGLVNLFRLYLPALDRWVVYDNAEPLQPLIVAYSAAGEALVMDDRRWENLRRKAR